jgi:hypothetical protein
MFISTGSYNFPTPPHNAADHRLPVAVISPHLKQHPPFIPILYDMNNNSNSGSSSSSSYDQPKIKRGPGRPRKYPLDQSYKPKKKMESESRLPFLYPHLNF